MAQTADTILRDGDVEGFLAAEIKERTTETFRQNRRGHPGSKTRYVRNEATRFDPTWRIDHERLIAESRCDGIFPLVTNATSLSAVDLRPTAVEPTPVANSRIFSGRCAESQFLA